MEERCKQCSVEVPEDDGYENREGELMCTSCFAEFWGPLGEDISITDLEPADDLLAILSGD